MIDVTSSFRRGAGAGWLLALGAALACMGGCTPIPPGSVGVVAGPTSDQWDVEFDPVLRTPTLLRNKTIEDTGLPPGTRAVPDTAAVLAVMNVFHDRDEWFRLRPDLDDFRVVWTHEQGWLRMVRLGQLYQQLPVCGGGYEARVLPNGRVGSLEGRYFPDIHLEINPILSPDQAEVRARDLITPGAPIPATVPRVQFENDLGLRSEPRLLVVLPRGGAYTLTWGVIVRSNVRDVTRAYVDAINGSVLGAEVVGTTDTYGR